MTTTQVFAVNVKVGVLGCVALAVGLVAQVASAQSVTVQNMQAMGINYNWAVEPNTETLDVNGEGNQRVNIRNNYGAMNAGKVWMQFDLSDIWAQHGQENLASASLRVWNANGISRQFDVAGLADNAGLENWNLDIVTGNNGGPWTWDTAPANLPASGYVPNPPDPEGGNGTSYKFDSTKIHGGVNVWEARNAVAGGHDVQDASLGYGQNAWYDSSDYGASGNILSFLQADTDGKVTFLFSGSPSNNNQSIFVAPAGSWPYDPADPLTVVSSPTLFLEFGAVGLLADYNENGNVDAADYVVWRKNDTANVALPNDNGLSTQADRYNLWRANFGEMTMPGVGTSVAVPEPNSALLLVCALMIFRSAASGRGDALARHFRAGLG